MKYFYKRPSSIKPLFIARNYGKYITPSLIYSGPPPPPRNPNNLLLVVVYLLLGYWVGRRSNN
jgi:hypothetical protein